jgi:hypothetical protein
VNGFQVGDGMVNDGVELLVRIFQPDPSTCQDGQPRVNLRSLPR